MHKVVLLVFEGFQILDASGPIAALESAGVYCPGAYSLELRASTGGLVQSSAGVGMPAKPFGRSRGIETLIVVGGDGTRGAARCKKTLSFIRRCYEHGTRVASVCSGTYLLAAAGLLDGRRATTHWCRTADFQRRFPAVQLDADRIYVRDGRIWSSAGVTAGIDLTLALITEDLGEQVARKVAQQLVVYYRRPGGQSQFSELLELETGGPFEGLMDFIRAHLASPLSVDALAEHVGMSPRNFSRRFTEQVGVSPGQAVQRVRAEAARTALESDLGSVAQIAHRVGFGDAERMRRTFMRLYGLPPSVFLRGRSA